MTGPVHLGDGTDGALFLHGYCRKYTRITYQYDNRHLTSWLLQGKTKKTLCGDTENSVTACRCISVQYGGGTKITVRKVLSDYNLTTKMDMPGRQTF